MEIYPSGILVPVPVTGIPVSRIPVTVYEVLVDLKLSSLSGFFLICHNGKLNIFVSTTLYGRLDPFKVNKGRCM